MTLLPITPANAAYADQVEATVRDRGPISTDVLARIVPESPIRRYRRVVGGWRIRADTPMTAGEILPYLAVLRTDYRVDLGASDPMWRAIARPTVLHGLVDPLPAVDAHGDGSTSAEGRRDR